MRQQRWRLAGSGDYPQNWYDQGIVVDPNNPDRAFFDTFEIWLVSRTGTAWYDTTCGYNGTSVNNHVVHVDQHALAFVNGSSDILLVGNDGGVHATLNASTAVPRHHSPDVDESRWRHQCYRVLLRRHQRQLRYLGESLCGGRSSGQRTQLGDVLRPAHQAGCSGRWAWAATASPG